MFRQQRLELAQRVVARADAVPDVGAVEPGNDQPVPGDAELGEDVGPGMRVRRGGEGKARHCRKAVEQRAQQAIVGPEIVPPFRYAVCLVDGEQADRCSFQQRAEVGLAGAFGGDVEKVQLAPAEAPDRRLAIRVCAGQGCSADAVGGRAPELVVHQGDQGRNDDAGAFQHHGGELVGQALAGAGRHDGQRRFARKHARHDLLLNPAECGKAEGRVKGFECALPGVGKDLRIAHAGSHATAYGVS